MATLDEVLARKKPLRQTLNVRLDVDSDETVDFTFQALGRKAWRELVDAYPPTEEQQAEADRLQADAGVPERKRERLWYDADQFPVPLLAASIVEPACTIESVQAMWDGDSFADGELERMLTVAIGLNRIADATVNWGKGLEQTPDSETGSPSAEPTESPSPSS